MAKHSVLALNRLAAALRAWNGSVAPGAPWRCEHARGFANHESAPEAVYGSYDLIATDTGLARIDSCAGNGFMVNNTVVRGSVLCYSNLWMMWRPLTVDDITVESLMLMKLLKPRPSMLLLGSGATMRQPPRDVLRFLQREGVAIEILTSEHASSYFNILNAEDRKVIGALLPLAPHEPS